jgi:hypothetical protein
MTTDPATPDATAVDTALRVEDVVKRFGRARCSA